MPESEWLPIVRETAIDAMMALIREDLAALDVRHDVFFSERSLPNGAATATRSARHDRVAARPRPRLRGPLPPPKGQRDEDWEDREQTLFRATAFGDDVDRPLLKSDGSYTYFAADIAYHRSKFERGFPEMIDVWGADHGGYVKRMQAAVRAVTEERGELDVKLCQLVKLLRGGEPVKMSKRAGDFVTLREVVDEVGRDAVRFMMLFRKNDATLDFDLAKVVEQSQGQPGLLRPVRPRPLRLRVPPGAAKPFPDADFAPATARRGGPVACSPTRGSARCCGGSPSTRVSSKPQRPAHEPHRIAFYLYDLAGSFHSLWNKGKDLPHLRFVNQTDRESTKARLALVQALRSVLASGLAILGVTAPDEMR